jgi:hypothetical protein
VSRQSGEREEVKRKGPKIDDALKERVFGAIRSGCQEIRPEGLSMTEINARAKTGYDRAFYAAKALIDDKRVFLARCVITEGARKVNVYRTTEHLKLTEDGDPPDPEPDPVAKKKKEPKPPKVNRLRLLESRHKALRKNKKRREERMDSMFGAEANTQDWSED